MVRMSTLVVHGGLAMRDESEYIAVELQPKNVIFVIFKRFNGHKPVGLIYSPASRFIYSTRAFIRAN